MVRTRRHWGVGGWHPGRETRSVDTFSRLRGPPDSVERLVSQMQMLGSPPVLWGLLRI